MTARTAGNDAVPVAQSWPRLSTSIDKHAVAFLAVTSAISPS